MRLTRTREVKVLKFENMFKHKGIRRENLNGCLMKATVWNFSALTGALLLPYIPQILKAHMKIHGRISKVSGLRSFTFVICGLELICLRYSMN